LHFGGTWAGRGKAMESGIFGYIQKFSKPQQVLILLLTACSFPFLYLSYQVPKEIIDKAIGGKNPGNVEFPKDVFGFEFGQLEYLYTLCGLFLALVFINGGFKYCAVYATPCWNG
jgi:putative ABC transport system ATP-binding protein